MKKALLLVLIAVFAITGSIAAMDFDVLSTFAGSDTPAGTCYVNVMDNVDLLVGKTIYAPGSKSEELGLALNLGVRTSVPVLEQVDIYFENSKSSITGSVFKTNTLVLAKNWMFPLTDKVQIGIAAELARVDLQGGKSITIGKSIAPAIGATVSLF
jgi:hypothetical protein